MKAASFRDIALIVLPIALLLGLAAFLVAKFVQPAPPRVVVMSTGSADGAYHAFAERYRAQLAKYGIRLELKPSAGSVENLARLRAGTDGVSVALLQGGIAGAEGATGLMTLGSVFYEPLWCFYRGAAIPLGTGLRGRRIAVGVPGSGTREVALRLLREIGMAGPPTRLVDIGGLEAAQALEGGEVDAAFYVSSADAAAVQRLLRAPGVNLLPAQRAEAVTRRLTFLHKLTLPEGAVDLARDIPRRDVPMLAVTASLVASEDLHPVIVDLLLEAARSVHGGPGLFHGIGEFPAPRDLEFPLSPDAERFYRGNPPLLRRYLPFWAVVWINRFIVVGIPLLLLALPFLRFLPSVYQWRMRRRIYRWYGELRFIESDVRLGTVDPAQLRVRLDRLERQVEGLRVPHAYSSMHYLLKSHIQLVRDLIAGRTA